jgi:hypothetical protein
MTPVNRKMNHRQVREYLRTMAQREIEREFAGSHYYLWLARGVFRRR